MFNDFVNLVNPIVFLDLASTSLDLKSARIVRISTIKILPDTTRIFVTNLINPGINISKEATKIHGINDKIIFCWYESRFLIFPCQTDSNWIHH